MSYVYGRRGTGPSSPLIEALREELYPEPYAAIDWNAARNCVAKEDLYYPHPWIQDVLWWTLYKAEPLLLGSWPRRKALQEAMRHIHYEVDSLAIVVYTRLVRPITIHLVALAETCYYIAGSPRLLMLQSLAYTELYHRETRLKMQAMLLLLLESGSSPHAYT